MKSLSNDAHGWAELLSTRQATPPFQGEQRTRWAVIGAGFTGLACARRLAELHPNDSIILLEARAVAQAASGRNSGYAVAITHFAGPFDEQQRENYRRVNRINTTGLDILRDQVEANDIDCEWHEQGIYHTAADDRSTQELANFTDYLQRMEIPHTPLDQEVLSEKLGTSWYQQGVHVQVGALVQPAALLYGLVNTLPANVQLYENSPVLEIKKGQGHKLCTAHGTIEADNVMIATNFEAARLGQIERYVVGSTLSGSFTRQLSADEIASLGTLPQWGVLSLHSGGATVRLTQDGRICIRNTAEYHAGRLLSDSLLAQRQQIHRQGFENRFPQLRHVPFEYAWSGVEGISQNGTNFFQNPAPGLYLAGGYNGSGVSRGTAFGHALAEYASGGQSQLIDDCLACPAARWLPPSPLLDIGAWFTVRKRFRGVGRDR
jgi:glycine/D-amino acid oxidase-like deaminating enzyme